MAPQKTILMISVVLAFSSALCEVLPANHQLSREPQPNILHQQQQQPQQINHSSKTRNQDQNHNHNHNLLSPAQQFRLNSELQHQQHQQTETLERKQTYLQPLVRTTDHGIRVTLSEPVSARHLKLDNMLNTLDRIAYVMSKPAAILNAVKFVGIAVTTLMMSVFMLPGLGLDHRVRRRYRGHRTMAGHRYNALPFLSGAMNRADLEGLIELMAKNYDDTLNQAGFNDRSPCRERSLCVFGDMMACDFPNIIISIGKFAQNHLPPVDMAKNKYTKALMTGLNQTDCDLAYKTDFYECPSLRDYVKSYFHGGVKKRRDLHAWWRN